METKVAVRQHDAFKLFQLTLKIHKYKNINYFKQLLDKEIVGALKSGSFSLQHLIVINFS